MQTVVTYDYKGLTLIKLTDSIEDLGSHSSIEVPKEYPFADENGMFAAKGQEGVFFISQGRLRDVVHIRSGLKPNHEVYRLMHKEVRERRMEYLDSLRHHDGFGPVLNLAGFVVRKVSDEIPYIGYLRTHPITDALYEKHEWLYEPTLVRKKVVGVYRILKTREIFFVKSTEIAVHGDEDNHPLLAALLERFPVPNGYYDDRDEGPFGGAFASDEDYWNYRDPSLFR